MDPQQGIVAPQRPGRLRVFFSLVCGALAIGYAAGIVLGVIPPQQRLDASALIALALTAAVVVLLASPGLVDRLKRLELQGFKLEMLEKVKDKQALQEERLDDIALMLPLLFPERERALLLSLAAGSMRPSKGSHDVRVELRRLRSIGLLRMRPSHYIADLKDNLEIDLATLVELTPLGMQWSRRLKEIAATENGDTPETSA